MKKINIVFKEVLSRVISIEAHSIEEAIKKAEDMYRKEEVCLDWSDLDGEVFIQKSQ